MNSPHWQLKTPINTVVFDCDGTLSTIEGIDELARKNGVGEQVKELTRLAMGKTGLNPNLYEHRLNLVKPTEEQVLKQGQDYFNHVVPDVKEIIQIFTRLNKNIFIISAGLLPAVAHFGELLGISRKNIYAVAIEFTEQGEYLDYDRSSTLVDRNGKREILERIKRTNPEVIYVGDGMNDLAVYDLAERFVGYGGSFYYEKLASNCQYYIKMQSMAPLLPLTLSEHEIENLTVEEKILFDKGLAAISNGHVKV